MSGISINKHIYKILSTDEKLKALVGKNIYPIVAENDCTMPFITFTKGTVRTTYFKVGVARDIVNFSINIVALDYATTVDIAERVRQLLELRTSDYFTRIQFSDCTEAWSGNAFTQTLQFEATI